MKIDLIFTNNPILLIILYNSSLIFYNNQIVKKYIYIFDFLINKFYIFKIFIKEINYVIKSL